MLQANVWRYLFLVTDSTLTYCIFWPESLENLMQIFNTLALDFFSEAKMECWAVEGFNYFTKVWIAITMPLTVSRWPMYEARTWRSGMAFSLTRGMMSTS